MNQTNQRNKIVEMYCLLAVDLLAIIISYMIAIEIRFGSLELLGRGELHYMVCLCFMLFCTMFSLLIDWNRGFQKRGYLVEFTTVLKYNVIMVMVVAFALFLLKQAEHFSRLTFGYFFISNLLLTFIMHVGVKKALREYMKREHNRVKILIITEKAKLQETLDNVIETKPLNYDISALVLLDCKETGNTYQGIPVVADRESLMEVAKQIPLDEVFIRLENESNGTIRELIHDFESMGVLCHYSIDLIDWNDRESSIGKFGTYTVVTYSIFSIDYRRRLIKRMIDIVGGLVGLLITGVLTPFVALAIKLDSRGPVFFSQIRIGKNGRRFKFYKFRSMYTDAEERKKELQDRNEIQGLMFKMEDDPRITKVGRFIRKTSIDELPQFYNVLRGDMSLIGTRPPTEDEFEQYNLYYRRRLCMTPGLTGLWQVSGRSDIEDFDQVVKLDLEYIDNWSLSLDIKILMKTIFVIFTGKGSK